MFQGNGYFRAFSVDILWGKCERSFLTNHKYFNEIVSYLVQV